MEGCESDRQWVFRPYTDDDRDFVLEGTRETLLLEGVEMSEMFAASTTKLLLQCNALGRAHLVTSHDGTRVAFAYWERGSATPFVPNGTDWWNEYAWLSLVWVHPQWRRHGIGRSIYAYVANRARLEGLKELHLDVYESNPRSVLFHTALGFKNYATVMRRPRDEPVSDGRRASIHWRAFDSESNVDRALILEGLVEIYTAEGNGAQFADPDVRDFEVRTFAVRMGARARIAVDDQGNAMGFYSSQVTDTHPFGVAYGTYDYRYAFLDYIFVAPAFRRLGIASAVMMEMQRIATEASVDWIISSAGESNELSIKWHQRMGFKPYVRVFMKPL